MKLLAALLVSLTLGSAGSGVKPCALKGKVRFVQNHADYKVYVNQNFPDVDVQLVQNFPNQAGKWQVVQAHEDFSVQIVQNRNDADFEVRFVERWPRCR